MLNPFEGRHRCWFYQETIYAENTRLNHIKEIEETYFYQSILIVEAGCFVFEVPKYVRQKANLIRQEMVLHQNNMLKGPPTFSFL